MCISVYMCVHAFNVSRDIWFISSLRLCLASTHSLHPLAGASQPIPSKHIVSMPVLSHSHVLPLPIQTRSGAAAAEAAEHHHQRHFKTEYFGFVLTLQTFMSIFGRWSSTVSDLVACSGNKTYCWQIMQSKKERQSWSPWSPLAERMLNTINEITNNY